MFCYPCKRPKVRYQDDEEAGDKQSPSPQKRKKVKKPSWWRRCFITQSEEEEAGFQDSSSNTDKGATEADSDVISDHLETTDTDTDVISDHLETTDTDSDVISDHLETTKTDSDVLSDHLETTDTDTDVISDHLEAAEADSDVISDHLETTDTDTDVISDHLETTDTDVISDHLEAAEADSDVISDHLETTKTDSDVISDHLETTKTDSDVLSDHLETTDTDSDVISDHLEAAEADSDVISDHLETTDTDTDVISDHLEAAEADSDVISDHLETTDTDTDVISDHLETTDTDTDVISDHLETTDTDSDVLSDHLETTDTDSDVISDHLETTDADVFSDHFEATEADSDELSTNASLTGPLTVREPLSREELICLGFPNLAQTCYMNSTLQGLLTLTHFVQEVHNQLEVWHSHPGSQLISGFVEVGVCHFTDDMTEKKSVLTAFKKTIAEFNSEFKDNRQKDAHEFLNCVLHQLRTFSINVGIDYTCPVDAHIAFQMLSTRTCQGCGIQSRKEESYLNLSLDLVPGDSVSQCLQAYMRNNQLNYPCECGARKSSQQWSFFTLPNVLTLQLKRFTFTPFYQLKKLNSRVLLSPELVLNTKSSVNEQVHYSLVSIISHLGTSANSGHYICDSVHQKQTPTALTDSWLTYDDEDVMETIAASVFKRRQRTAYLLFYERQQ